MLLVQDCSIWDTSIRGTSVVEELYYTAGKRRLEWTLKSSFFFKKKYLFVNIDKFSLRCRPKAATVGDARALIKPVQKHRRHREHMHGAVTLESSDRLVSHSFPNSKWESSLIVTFIPEWASWVQPPCERHGRCDVIQMAAPHQGRTALMAQSRGRNGPSPIRIGHFTEPTFWMSPRHWYHSRLTIATG